MAHWAAVLAGGSGTRFWPVSTSARPKQLLPLAADAPLLAQTVDRLAGLIPPERILIITGASLFDATRALLPQLPAENILVEPRAASTGPALVWATEVAAGRDPDAALLAMHADWFVGDAAAFRTTAAEALAVAEDHDVLVTVGIIPTRPDESYGYIEPGDPLAGTARRVRRFTEKPEEDVAARLIAGGALWNSGLFAWTARRFRAETESHVPEIAPHLPALAASGVETFFAAVDPIAVDVSHFERSRRVAVVRGTFPWDDVGTWAALARVRDADASGNVFVGNVHGRETVQSVAWSEDGDIVLYGVEDLVVVRTDRITLVTTRERAAHLKELLETLPPSLQG